MVRLQAGERPADSAVRVWKVLHFSDGLVKTDARVQTFRAIRE
jgi:hypothetical protein